MVINSRKKGARYELEIARYLSENGFPSRRGQQFSGSPDSPDVVSDEFPVLIEAKRVQRLNLQSAFTQAIKDAGDKPPCVVHRVNHGENMITMRLADFVELLNKKSWEDDGEVRK